MAFACIYAMRKARLNFQPCFNLFPIVMQELLSILLILPQRLRNCMKSRIACMEFATRCSMELPRSGVWNQAAENAPYGDAIHINVIPYSLTADAIPNLQEPQNSYFVLRTPIFGLFYFGELYYQSVELLFTILKIFHKLY